MKILCVIDSLGSGGAQRQMVNLACGLKGKGHEVELFIYHPHLDLYRPILDEDGIPIHEVHGVSGFSFQVVKCISKLIREKRFDAVISFLPSPNIYLVLASFVSLSALKIIVSERTSKEGDVGFWGSILRRVLYIKAGSVVVNSHNHARFLQRFFWLNRKIHTIYNGYSFEDSVLQASISESDNFSLLVVGRNSVGKNGFRLLQALLLFHQRNGYMPEVSWAGRQEQDQQSLATRAEMDQLIAEHPALQAQWQWLGERMDIPQLLADSDALIHVSIYEGLPNVVCEAFIAGRPVIASAVCDHPILVEEGMRGLLCDPLSPASICAAIERFIALSPEARQAMGYNARRYAEEHLTLERMVAKYEALLT